MSRESGPHADDPDSSAIQREILAGRKFSIGEAIGRMAGKDLLKGASPVARKRQAELELRHALNEHLRDVEGALGTVLFRRFTESKAFLGDAYERPVRDLGAFIDRLLGSDAALRDLVRETDMEWGRANDTRPHFYKEGEPRHADDPYTGDSVRSQLVQLRERLPAG